MKGLELKDMLARVRVRVPNPNPNRNPNQAVVVDLVADEGAVVEGDAVRQLLMREHNISRGHTHLHLVSVRVRVRVRVMLMVRVRVLR